MKPSVPFTAAAFAMLLCTTALAQTKTLEISRCNVRDGNTFRPALIIKPNGETREFRIGDRGLTRFMIFDEGAAKRFIARHIDISGLQLTYSDCGTVAQGGGSAPPAAAPAVAAPPPPPPPPPPTTGGGCSCGPCYGA